MNTYVGLIGSRAPFERVLDTFLNSHTTISEHHQHLELEAHGDTTGAHLTMIWMRNWLAHCLTPSHQRCYWMLLRDENVPGPQAVPWI